MNYQKIYNDLIAKRIQDVNTTSFCEKHHIKPKSIHPELEHESSNIVRLTYREHFVAHLLLVKIYKQLGNKVNEQKMANAVMRMSRRKKYERISSREYDKIKSSLKGNGPNKGRKFSLEARIHMSEAQKGKIPYNKGKRGLLYAVNNGKITKMIPCAELNNYLSNGWIRGRIKGQYKLSASTRLKISAATKGKKKPNTSKALKGRSTWNKGKHYKQSDLVHHNRALQKSIIETQQSLEQYLAYAQQISVYQNEILAIQKLQQQLIQDKLREIPHDILNKAITTLKLHMMMNIGTDAEGKTVDNTLDQLIQIMTIEKTETLYDVAEVQRKIEAENNKLS